MFGTIAGGFPLGPAPGGTEDLLWARAETAAGRMDPTTLGAATDQWVHRYVDEQIASGLALVSDAGARWLDGLPGLARDLLAGTLGPDDVVAAWRHADRDTNVLTKQVLPGPWSAAWALAGSPGDRADLATALGVALAAVARALHDASCPIVQLDEPATTLPGDGAGAPAGDLESTAHLPPTDPDDGRAERAGLAAGFEALAAGWPPGLSLCLSLPGGTPRPDLSPVLTTLPVQSFLVDVTGGPDAWRFIGRLRPEQGVVVGAIDARDPTIEDPEMLVWAAALAAMMGDRGSARVGVSSSGSLAGLDRHRARRKMEQAGMATRLAAMGPLVDVARALQPDPATSRIRGLPALIAAWLEGTGRSVP